MPKRNQLTADQRLTANAAYERTVARRLDIESKGYRIVEIWECEIYRELKTNVEMKRFFDTVLLTDPMDPREGKKNFKKLFRVMWN